MMNADILIRGNATQDDLIDAVQGNRVYIPAFIAVNKVDLVDKERYLEIEHDIAERFGSPPIMISAAAGFHTEELKDAIYDSLGFMRVYLKPVGEEADLEEPLIVQERQHGRGCLQQAPPGFCRRSSGMHGSGESRSSTRASGSGSPTGSSTATCSRSS